MPEPVVNTQRSRLYDIDRAKGLAIALVVLGHIVQFETPAGNDWYEHLKYCIYEFHMAFFMYLSGFVMFHSGAAWIAPAQYRNFLWRRAIRCIVPFLLFGVISVFLKLLASTVIAVHNPP